ncbi:hypothetical protein M2T79_09285 [Elizabethkingia miricola]|uniref:hypothetical protein n=1 Tax=Elizabethkingia miricola TaxID=172045 RepID=UPI00201933F9|nr:hypothetical protein [Elizabethkingia miricola]MCL1656791.1 hypothetical protein [Elizabethkingia miricola]
MTPKEKADKLYWKFVKIIDPHWGIFIRKDVKLKSIQCAIISAEESLRAVEKYGRDNDELQNMENEFRFWNEVKQELEKMK